MSSSRIQGYGTKCLIIAKLKTLATEKMMTNCEAENHSNNVPQISVQHTLLNPTDVSLFTIK